MDTKVKILRVVTQAEVVPWHLKNFLDRATDDFVVFVAGNDVSRYQLDFPLVKFIDIQIERKSSPIKDLAALFKLIKICRDIKPHILHSLMPKCGLLCAIAGFFAFVPIRIHTFTGQVWSTKRGASRMILKLIDKFVFYLNTKCLTDSPSQSQFLANAGFIKNKQAIECLGKGSLSGVDLKRFNLVTLKEKTEFRKQLGLQESDFVFTFLARKSIVKGIIPLFASFEVFSSFKDVKLLFIGPDESNGALSHLYEKYAHFSDQIVNLDIVKDHEKYLSISDVLCLPSSSEGFGTIVIEAAALKVPTVGFNIVGLSDAIDNHKTGILVELNDVKAFSNAMKSLYSDQKSLGVLSENARNRVLEYFSADVLYDLQKSFYKTLLQEN